MTVGGRPNCGSKLWQNQFERESMHDTKGHAPFCNGRAQHGTNLAVGTTTVASPLSTGGTSRNLLPQKGAVALRSIDTVIVKPAWEVTCPPCEFGGLNGLPRRVVDSLPSGMEERSIDVDSRGNHVRVMVTQKVCEISRSESMWDPYSKQKILSEKFISCLP